MNRCLPFLLCILICSFSLIPTSAFAVNSSSDETVVASEDSIKTITIRKTGFMSKSTTIIKYRTRDGSIVSVEKNGKLLPESQFRKYKDTVEDVISMRVTTDLEQAFAEERLRLENEDISIAEKLASVESILDTLEPAASSYESSMYDYLSTRQHLLLVDSLRIAVEEMLTEADASFRGPVLTLKVKKDQCVVNGKAVSEETSQSIMDLYSQILSKIVADNESVEIYFD